MKVFLTIVITLLVAVSALAIEGTAGPYKVSVRTAPETVPVGKAKVEIMVMNAAGKPVSKAIVKVLAKMPGMSMGEREETATEGSTPGSYTAPAAFSMAGRYDLSLSIQSDAGSGSTVLSLSTGQSSESPSQRSPAIYYVVGFLLIVAIIVWRMRVTRQKVDLSSALKGKTIFSVLMLVGALGLAIWAVNAFRREGSMTPLEAQVMEMNTPAPEGVMPVVLAEAKEIPFAESVTYSGQVVGFVEQDVVTRVTGTIRSMPVYVGDKVKKGQLLARLDTSQLDPMVAEKSAGVTSASQGVSVATSEYSQAQNMVTQALADVTMAESEVAEAKSMVEAATASQSSARANVESAVADSESAKADLNAAQADLDYQSQEIDRMRALFAKGAVSKDELQRAQADFQRASAMTSSARERVNKGASMVRGAQGELAKSRAELAAASTRVRKAEANLRSKRAQVKSTQSGVATAKAKIGQSRASVAEASASLSGAVAQKSYAELRAEVDGVVTQRLISPGVVVNPGQSLLRIAQVSPVRIQANVPQQDLARIHRGDRVRIYAARGDLHPVLLTVTSVSPTVEAASRMGVIEAVYDNKDERFSPGQFVSLEIAIGPIANTLAIPTDAIESDSHGADRVYRVWLARDSGIGEFKVEHPEIQIGGRTGSMTAVKGGLKPGDKVVLSPYGLAVGSRVRPTDEPILAAPGVTTIEITESGYSPATVALNPGKPTKLIFLRKVKDTCATSVDFPELGLHAETPLNERVTVEVPAQPAGKELTFTCPMNMYKGRAVAK